MTEKKFNLNCPLPLSKHETVQLSHGGGGKMMHRLIEEIFIPAFKNDLLEARHDGAVLNIGETRLAYTTDSYVVHPIFFPGGDIGDLAVNGTVNDLAMCGAKPLYLSCAMILEEGFPIEDLKRVADSMKKAAASAKVLIVTGDTKVVDKGKGDGIFIAASGIGVVEHSLDISPKSVRAGDAVIVNGDLGRHGVAVMAARDGLSFENPPESDTADLSGIVLELLGAGIEVHCMRDLTRGGLASSTVEISQGANLQIHLDESAIPILNSVQGACEVLGLDPLYVANEGRFVLIVRKEDADRALEIMRKHPCGKQAALIGEVRGGPPMVSIRNRIGSNRILDMLSGEQLPRIC